MVRPDPVKTLGGSLKLAELGDGCELQTLLSWGRVGKAAIPKLSLEAATPS